MQNFIHFLKSNASSKYLILYPQTFSNFNVIGFLVAIPELAGNNVTIITDNPKFINESLGRELPGELYVKYADVNSSKQVKNTLNNNGFVFIDNYNDYISHSMDSFLTLNNKARIICLTNGFINSDISNEWYSLALNIFDEGPLLNYNIVNINKNDEELLSKTILSQCLLKIKSKHLIEVNKDKCKALSEFINKENLTNIIINIDNKYQDIEYVHLVDVSLDNFIKVMKLYQRSNFNLSISMFNIIFYIDDSNSDIEEYNKICDYIEKHQLKYMEILKRSKLLQYTDKYGVCVD